MALFNILISPLNAFPWVINGLMEAWVSTKRIQAFLKLSELDLDQYYANMSDTVREEHDQNSNACSSPGADSQQSEAFEKKSEVGITVTETPKCGSPDSNRLEPTVSGASLHVINNRDLRDHDAAVSPHSPSWEDRHGYLQGSPAVRGGRRRNRVVIVRNGCFTWTRRDGEGARDNGHDSGGGGEKIEKGERSGKVSVLTEENADSGEVASPVEWTLSDLNFTIYSVNFRIQYVVVTSTCTCTMYFTCVCMLDHVLCIL